MAESKVSGTTTPTEDREDCKSKKPVEDSKSGLSGEWLRKQIGIALEWLLYAILLLHMHVFFLFYASLKAFAKCRISERTVKKGRVDSLALSFIFLSPSMTTAFIVYMINDVAERFHEIQSYEIAYITWGACVSITWWIPTVIHMINGDDESECRDKVSKWLLYPFGVKPSDARRVKDSDARGVKPSDARGSRFWSIPLVSLAPSMVAGFLANFFLETKYLIACDQSLFDPISDVCFHEEGVCCMVISSHTKPITFLASMASTILAAWGVVKGIGLLICSAEGYETEEEEKIKDITMEVMQEVMGEEKMEKITKKVLEKVLGEDKIKEITKKVMGSRSGRNILRQSIAEYKTQEVPISVPDVDLMTYHKTQSLTFDSAEENETQKTEPEAGRVVINMSDVDVIIDNKEEEDMVQTIDLSEENETKNGESEAGSVDTKV